MDVRIEESWKEILREEFAKSYFHTLADFVKSEYIEQVIYPPGKEIFSAFEHCPFNKVKVVILGQDPYHGPGQAHGMCFSVREGVKLPPSLKNIFKEIQQDLGKDIPVSGELTRWADQGVLLLNATLTVRAKQPGSHQKRGWEEFTDQVIKTVSEKKDQVVFLLWGAFAQSKEGFIDPSRHLVLKAAHPSPFSVHRGFFGCGHFSKTNEFLSSKGKEPIVW